MAWTTSNTYTDIDTGVIIARQIRKRNGHGTESRYLVKAAEDKYMILNITQLFNVADALDDITDMISDGEF